MKKRVALLLALMLAFGLGSAALGDGDTPIDQTLVDQVLAAETDSSAATAYKAAHEENLELKLRVVDLQASDSNWDGTLDTVYSFKLEWEVTPGKYTRGADTYIWDAKKLVYTRKGNRGFWGADTHPSIKLKMTNYSNTQITMMPEFTPKTDLKAFMATPEKDTVYTAASAAGAVTSVLDGQGKEQTVECVLNFYVEEALYSAISDSIGTLAVGFSTDPDADPCIIEEWPE